MIADAYQLEHGVVFDTSKSDGQMANNKLRNYLLNFKFTPLKDEIEETVQWFILNYNKLESKKNFWFHAFFSIAQ